MKTREKIRSIRKYSWYLFKHRTFTMIECFKEGLIWRGLTHDLSKLRPSEFFPYAYFFYKDKKPKRDRTGYYKPYDTGDMDFELAWLKHCRRNDHHWQWHALVLDGGDRNQVICYPMSDKAWREMICDWRGAARAQKAGSIYDWYEKNKYKIRLHEETRKEIERELEKRKRGANEENISSS